MNRVQTLTEEEYKVLLAVREATALKPKTASPDIQQELNNVSYELSSISGSNWEEVVQEVQRRIYGMQY